MSKYNTKLAATKGYTSIDWKLVKAVLWVESGGPKNPEWKKRPIQIGVGSDQGLPTLRAGAEASLLIMDAQLTKDVKTGRVVTDPKLNVRAGIAYLLTRMALSDIESIEDAKHPEPQTYKVKPGDTFGKIANKVGTTVEVLQRLNPEMKVLHEGDPVKWVPAKKGRVITGWRSFTTANVATRYNGGRDPVYAAKLDYVLGLFQKLKR